jgi:hypothetical protein
MLWLYIPIVWYHDNNIIPYYNMIGLIRSLSLINTKKRDEKHQPLLMKGVHINTILN